MLLIINTHNGMQCRKNQQMSTLSSNEIGIGNHVIVDQIFKKKYIRTKCPHDRVKSDCKICSPNNFCVHLRKNSQCKDCKGGTFCEHNRRRSVCKDCRGGSICEHFRQRNNCKDCRESSICEHLVKRASCKTCRGSGICEHLQMKYLCKQCKGVGICVHLRRKGVCKECNGAGICVHFRQRSQCIDCKGANICECGKQKSRCAKHGGSQLCRKCHLTHGNPNFDKHCVDCFVNYYPNDPRSDRNSKLMRRETVVRQAIDGVFKGFIHDKAYFTGGCCEHRRRVDHRIHINDTVLAIETDENAHVSYNKDDEIIRYDDLVMALGTKFVFIRFNCDTNREEHGAKTTLEHKINALLLCIGKQIKRIRKNENTELCDIVKLFYCVLCSKNSSDICLCPGPA